MAISSPGALVRSLVSRVATLRYNLVYYWYALDKGNVFFILAIGVAIGLLSSIGYFTYSQHNSVEAQKQRLADINRIIRRDPP